MDPETTELISRCKAGERQALDLLYQQYRPKLLNICKHYAKEDVVAEDLLHDAFVVILTSLDKLEQTDKPEPWMTAIVKNVCHHYQLHVKKEQATLRQMAKEGWPSAEEIPVPDYDEIQAFISQLPQDYQRLFRLSVFEGLSHKEISQLLGITPNSSSKRLSNAKRMLRLLIRQSWVLMLLFVAIPTAVWWLFHKQVSTDEQTPVVSQDTSKPQITTSAEKPEKPPVYTQASSSSPSPSPSIRRSKGIKTGWIPQQPAHHPNEVSILPDSVPRLVNDSMTVLPTKTAQTKEEEVLKDTIIYPPTLWQPDGNQIAIYPTKAHQQWNVSLAYNGQMGRGEDFMAAATIENNFSMGVIPIPSTQQFTNWKDYFNYLNTNPSNDPESRSLQKIASQNIDVNNGAMEARYEHQLPITLQMMLSRQISEKASIETGLSYTQLNSTITTGSSSANIQEHQKLRYVGIPIRFGWTWYDKARLRFYSSAGGMLEMPIHSTVGVRHFYNGTNTFQKEVSPHVPVQWSVSLGLGAQYNVTPHLGIYLEPSLQYYINNGSGLKTYRTEHPFELTLPLGLRFHW